MVGLGCDPNAGVNLSLKSSGSGSGHALMGGGVGTSSLTTANLMNSLTPASSMTSSSITIEDFDTPLNLSMKPDKSTSSSGCATSSTSMTSVSSNLGGGVAASVPNDLSSGRLAESLGGMVVGGGMSGAGAMMIGSGGGVVGGGSNSSLQSLSSITAALGGISNNTNNNNNNSNGLNNNNNPNNNSMMNILPSNTTMGLNSNSGAINVMSGVASNNNNNNERQSMPATTFKEGRPRNLGRGVSKPKKNTVASLLAQSRAVGLKPMLATQQLLQQGADIVCVID